MSTGRRGATTRQQLEASHAPSFYTPICMAAHNPLLAFVSLVSTALSIEGILSITALQSNAAVLVMIYFLGDG